MSAPTTDPISWQALLFLQGCFQNISTANGFYTEAGANVSLQLAQLKEDGSETDDPFPTIRMALDDESATYEGQQINLNTVNVVIESVINVTEDNAQYKAHCLRADLIKAVPKKSRNWPNFIVNCKVASRRFLTRPSGMPVIALQHVFSVELLETT